MAKSLWERALEEGKKVEEKATGLLADVVESDGDLYLDDGGDYLTSVQNFSEDDFWIVNE